MRIKQAIMNGTLKSGEVLSENKLASEFIVSRTPVREALRVLESEGFVTVLPGRKIIVSVPTQRDIDEIYEIRLLVESEALRRITPRDHDLFDILDRCLTDSVVALRKDDFLELERINTVFHMALVSALKNERLRSFVDSIHDTAVRLRRYSLAKKGWAGRFVQEHKQLVALLKKGQTEAAVKLLKKHITTSVEIARSSVGPRTSTRSKSKG